MNCDEPSVRVSSSVRNKLSVWKLSLLVAGVFALSVFALFSLFRDEVFTEGQIIGSWRGQQFKSSTLTLLDSHIFVGKNLPRYIFTHNASDSNNVVSVRGKWFLSKDFHNTIDIELTESDGRKTNEVYISNIFMSKMAGNIVLYFEVGDPDSGDAVIFEKDQEHSRQ